MLSKEFLHHKYKKYETDHTPLQLINNYYLITPFKADKAA